MMDVLGGGGIRIFNVNPCPGIDKAQIFNAKAIFDPNPKIASGQIANDDQ